MGTANRISLPPPCLALLVLLLPALGWSATTTPSAPAMGQLKIEGGAVERVTLWRLTDEAAADPSRSWDSLSEAIDHSSKPTVLDRPGLSATIRAGTYIFAGAELKGGYSHNPSLTQFDPQTRKSTLTVERLTIGPDKPCVLKVGAPLEQKVSVARQGRVLHMTYRLLDSEGRRYLPENRDKPPQFAVYCNGREVGSGSFEYG
jgi:hypothetical protein